MQDIQGALYLLQAVKNQGKDLNAENCEALKIICTVAGCASKKLIRMIGITHQLQNFKIWTCAKKCILTVDISQQAEKKRKKKEKVIKWGNGVEASQTH